MFKFRPHRELLEDAIKKLQIFETKNDLLTYLTIKYPYLPDIDKHLVIEEYGYDNRINWNTYIVYLPDYGVWGFTDGPVK